MGSQDPSEKLTSPSETANKTAPQAKAPSPGGLKSGSVAGNGYSGSRFSPKAFSSFNSFFDSNAGEGLEHQSKFPATGGLFGNSKYLSTGSGSVFDPAQYPSTKDQR